MRGGIYWARETFLVQFRHRSLGKRVEKLALRHMHSAVKDPVLRKQLTPTFAIGCKRILPSNEWYPALAQPNVEVVTDGIAEVRERSIVSADGTEREVDTIIYGTGFHVTDIPIADRVRGVGGRSLDESWGGSAEAYKGTTVAGFPNLFLLVGPNTGLGHTSIVFMIESQLTYVLGALRRCAAAVRARSRCCPPPRPPTTPRYRRRRRARVWVSGGCESWYIDRNGKNSTLWPTFTWPFRQQLREFDEGAYALGAPREQRQSVAA